MLPTAVSFSGTIKALVDWPVPKMGMSTLLPLLAGTEDTGGALALALARWVGCLFLEGVGGFSFSFSAAAVEGAAGGAEGDGEFAFGAEDTAGLAMFELIVLLFVTLTVCVAAPASSFAAARPSSGIGPSLTFLGDGEDASGTLLLLSTMPKLPPLSALRGEAASEGVAVTSAPFGGEEEFPRLVLSPPTAVVEERFGWEFAAVLFVGEAVGDGPSKIVFNHRDTVGFGAPHANGSVPSATVKHLLLYGVVREDVPPLVGSGALFGPAALGLPAEGEKPIPEALLLAIDDTRLWMNGWCCCCCCSSCCC